MDKNSKIIKFQFRVSEIDALFHYPSGMVEIEGTCSLTGKLVCRKYDNINHTISEYNGLVDEWVDLDNGVFTQYMDRIRRKYNVDV
jgi:hypothetical protein